MGEKSLNKELTPSRMVELQKGVDAFTSECVSNLNVNNYNYYIFKGKVGSECKSGINLKNVDEAIHDIIFNSVAHGRTYKLCKGYNLITPNKTLRDYFDLSTSIKVLDVVLLVNEDCSIGEFGVYMGYCQQNHEHIIIKDCNINQPTQENANG